MQSLSFAEGLGNLPGSEYLDSSDDEPVNYGQKAVARTEKSLFEDSSDDDEQPLSKRGKVRISHMSHLHKPLTHTCINLPAPVHKLPREVFEQRPAPCLNRKQALGNLPTHRTLLVLMLVGSSSLVQMREHLSAADRQKLARNRKHLSLQAWPHSSTLGALARARSTSLQPQPETRETRNDNFSSSFSLSVGEEL